MSIKSSHYITLFLFYFTLQLNATTWDEPWQSEIIKAADYMVYARVVSNVDSIGMEVEIIKSFGQDLQGKILIDGFFMWDICSMSGGHQHYFTFAVDDMIYLFLKKGEKGNYELPTPTSGYAEIVDDKVRATYRHSYHMAAIDQELYEWSFQQIWNYTKNGVYNKQQVNEFIDRLLSKPAAGFSEDEIDTFFEQHVALEMAFLMNLRVELDILMKFTGSDNFHAQISAMRAMGNGRGKKTVEHLIEFIFNEEKDPFSKTMAIQALAKVGNKRQKQKVMKRVEELSEEETGFGGNIMDPRVCTTVPNPKRAALKYLAKPE